MYTSVGLHGVDLVISSLADVIIIKFPKEKTV